MNALALATRGYICDPDTAEQISGVSPTVMTATIAPSVREHVAANPSPQTELVDPQANAIIGVSPPARLEIRRADLDRDLVPEKRGEPVIDEAQNVSPLRPRIKGK